MRNIISGIVMNFSVVLPRLVRFKRAVGVYGDIDRPPCDLRRGRRNVILAWHANRTARERVWGYQADGTIRWPAGAVMVAEKYHRPRVDGFTRRFIRHWGYRYTVYESRAHLERGQHLRRVSATLDKKGRQVVLSHLWGGLPWQDADNPTINDAFALMHPQAWEEYWFLQMGGLTTDRRYEFSADEYVSRIAPVQNQISLTRYGWATGFFIEGSTLR